jgi:hypothetical protein
MSPLKLIARHGQINSEGYDLSLNIDAMVKGTRLF